MNTADIRILAISTMKNVYMCIINVYIFAFDHHQDTNYDLLIRHHVFGFHRYLLITTEVFFNFLW